METTMAATPKARLAAAPASAPDSSGPLAFPIPPPPPSSAQLMPTVAFPAFHTVAHAPSAGFRPTRRTTVRVPRESDGVRDSLAGLASFIENAPLPSLPDGVWTFIGRAWFFVAGTTMGILLALALIAGAGVKRTPARHARVAVATTSARVLVIQRSSTVAERGVGELAENDVVVDSAPVPAPLPVVHRTVAARRPVGQRATSTKDILSAGL